MENMTGLQSRPAGWVSVDSIKDAEGKGVSIEKAIKYGWLQARPGGEVEASGPNLFTDSGRQLLAFAFGEKSPISNFTCKRFGLGTGTLPPKVTDVSLENPIAFYLGGQTKPINLISFTTPFVAKVEFTIATTEANGFLITEMGLFSGNDTLIARRVHVGINKSSDFSPTLSWRIRL